MNPLTTMRAAGESEAIAAAVPCTTRFVVDASPTAVSCVTPEYSAR